MPNPSFFHQLEDVPWHPRDRASSAEFFDRCLTLPLSTTFDHFDLLGVSTIQSSSVAPGVSYPFAGTTPPSNALDSLHSPMPDEIISYERVFGTFKRSFGQLESSRRPEKRLCSIRPKPLPAEPSAIGNTSSTTPNTPTKFDVKEGNVPANMMATSG